MAIDEELDLPRPFGPYTLTRRLAVGGMAEVYVAKTKGLGGFEKVVAIKVIHPRYSEDEHFVQMLVEEAKISVLLTHVNIAQTFDLGCIDDTYYIVMELIEGADAYRVMRRTTEMKRAMPIDLCAHIAAEMCNGLDYAHRKRDAEGQSLGIVHRDISPQNVLISYAGEVKIVDFGIAKAALRSGQTEAGVIKGKYYYMSPEQAWGDPMDHRSDIFSTGVVLYELLTGRMLYQEDNVPLLLDKVRKVEVAPPETRRRSIPKALSDIVMKALSKEPQDRYQSAQEMAQALTQFLYQSSPTFTAARLAELMGTLFPNEVQRHSAIMKLPSVEESLPPEAQSKSVLFELGEEEDEDATRNDVLPFRRAQRVTKPAEEPGRPTLRPPRRRNVEGEPTRAASPRAAGGGSDQVTAPLVDPSGAWVSPVREMGTTSPRQVPDDSTDDTHSAPEWDDPTRLKDEDWSEQDATLVDGGDLAAALLAVAPKPEGAQLAQSERGKVNVQWAAKVPQNAAPPQAASAQRAAPPPPRPPPPVAKIEPLPSPSAVPRAPWEAPPSVAASPPVFTAPTGSVDPFASPPPSPPSATGGFEPPDGARRSAMLAIAAIAVVVLGVLAVIAVLGTPPPPAIEVISSPTGASVSIDGRPVDGVTPIVIADGIESGRSYRVEVAMAGYQPWAAQLAPTEGPLRQFVVLAPLPATLRVETDPPGAEVMVNGVMRGAAPIEVTGLQVGQEVEVRASIAGRAPVIRRVRLAEGTTSERILVTP
ncbi:serine/threonine-protein kinase [Sandaracinus amylolyticus]|uniref:serine/threonine-protein kinase n=1 Tax=Sandaracinus amylolyticus TaxID=927083 RepID=UPI001F00D447|nr:serine/threonine-protein kinase [Sandaracinus amylolyticus]UJR79870.1 Serine/threonine protein kinase [Sandaracinus amylolyticus]